MERQNGRQKIHEVRKTIREMEGLERCKEGIN
jgi:hypothetical protein